MGELEGDQRVTAVKRLTPEASSIFSGPLLPVFIRYTLPSAVGLLAITTSSLVDGIFVGHFIGIDALAAVNLLIPVLTFFFACVLTLAIGGSVRAGFLLGRGEKSAASKVLSTCLIFALGIAGLFVFAGYWGADYLYRLLQAPADLQAVLRQYFPLLLVGLPLQFTAVMLYYFLRTCGYPGSASTGLVTGAATNIILDALLVGGLNGGVAAAAMATVAAQAVQCGILVWHFYRKSPLQFRLRHWQPRQLVPVLTNGFSEFINEMSAGVVIATINLLVLLRLGVEGVAAFAVINYLQFAYLMLCYGFVDSQHVLVSHNRGAGNHRRAAAFLRVCITSISATGLLMISLLTIGRDRVLATFLPESSPEQAQLFHTLLTQIWPVFLLSGVNIACCAFLTASGRAGPSAVLSLLRSLILPVSLLLVFGQWLAREDFLQALPLAELMVLLTIIGLTLWSYRYSANPIEGLGARKGN